MWTGKFINTQKKSNKYDICATIKSTNTGVGAGNFYENNSSDAPGGDSIGLDYRAYVDCVSCVVR
jgi:hypothetical protein